VECISCMSVLKVLETIFLRLYLKPKTAGGVVPLNRHFLVSPWLQFAQKRSVHGSCVTAGEWYS
jgi:hypothetical protein